MKTAMPLRDVSLVLIAVVAGFTSILHAQDPLNSWARRDVPGLTADLNSVAYGNGIFVAVGAESAVARSADGIEWTVGSAGSDGSLRQVRFLNGEFVAVGNTNKILFSADGSNWTARAFPDGYATDIAYGNGVYVAASSYAYYSANGSDWLPTSAYLRYVTFGNGRFVGLRITYDPISFLPSYSSIYSTNGVDWTAGGSAPNSYLSGGIVFGDDRFIATGSQNAVAMASTSGRSCLRRCAPSWRK